MKNHGFFIILYVIAAVLAQNETDVLHQDNVDAAKFYREGVTDISRTSIAQKNELRVEKTFKRQNVSSLKISNDDESAIKVSLRPINLTKLELNRILTINGEACLANAIRESKNHNVKSSSKAKILPRDIFSTLNKLRANKLEEMVKQYGGACTLAIQRLYESRFPIAAYKVKLPSGGKSIRLEEIFGIEEELSKIGEKIKLEYGDHCLLGLFRMIRLVSSKLSDRMRNQCVARIIDKNNLRKLELVHGTECIFTVTKLLRISTFPNYRNENGDNHFVRGRKGDPDAYNDITKNTTFVIPEDFNTRYGKSCTLLIRKLGKLMESKRKLLQETSNDQKSPENIAKTQYLVERDFEEMSSTYGRTCLRAASGLLDIKVKKGGRIVDGKATRYYVVPSSMRNVLAWPFYATLGQSKKLADRYGTQCARGLYEFAKRQPTNDESESKVSITRRAYLRLDTMDYRKLKEIYGSDCSRALVTLLDIDADWRDRHASRNKTSRIHFVLFGYGKGLPRKKNKIAASKSSRSEKRSGRAKRARAAPFRFEQERITLQFRKLSARDQEQVCLYLRSTPRSKNPMRLVRKLLGNARTLKNEVSGVHYDWSRGHQLSLLNRRDRETLILQWACEDKRPNQDKLYIYAREAMSADDKDGKKKKNSPADGDKGSEVKFRMGSDLDELFSKAQMFTPLHRIS